VVLPYAAYLRVYEPLSAFPAADSSHWAAYAASAGRPRRAGSLAAEQADSLRRAMALPPLPAPERESGHAYVRWSSGVTYVCPWQTRLRSWLALTRLRSAAPSLTKAAFSAAQTEAAVRDFARWRSQESSPRVYIQANTWSVPFAWFVPFAPDERWLVLGTAGEPGDGGRTTAAGTRTLVYATAMVEARTRVAKAPGGSPPGLSAAIRRPSQPSSKRSGRGWRSSIRTPSSNSTTAGLCTCSTTARCVPTSPWRRCPPPSVRCRTAR